MSERLKIKCLTGLFSFPHTESKGALAVQKMYRKELLDFEQTDVVIGREGWYLQGKKCWFEADGKAYISRAEDFLFTLKCLNISELDKSVAVALETLQKVAPNTMTKHQKDIIDCTEHNEEIKRMGRDMKLLIRSLK
jgi:hypothetical protein